MDTTGLVRHCETCEVELDNASVMCRITRCRLCRSLNTGRQSIDQATNEEWEQADRHYRESKMKTVDLGGGCLAFEDELGEASPITFWTPGHPPPAPFKRRSIADEYERVAGDYELAKSVSERAKSVSERTEKKRTLLALAEDAIDDRHKKNDIPERNFARIAKTWSAILDIEVTAEQVALMMIAMKVVREAYSHQLDNLVDVIGYTLCLEETVNARTQEADTQAQGPSRYQGPYD